MGRRHQTDKLNVQNAKHLISGLALCLFRLPMMGLGIFKHTNADTIASSLVVVFISILRQD